MDIDNTEIGNEPDDISPEERAILTEMIELDREYDRRKTYEGVRYFKPTTSPDNDQEAVHLSDADERWVFGGARSGKTHLGVADCLLFAMGKHPVRSKKRRPPVKIRYCAPKWRENVALVLLQKFKEMTPRRWLRGGRWETGWSEANHTLSFCNGGFVQFKTYQEEVDTYHGIDLDAVYQDEHGPEPIYNANAARLADRNGFFMSTMTPEEGVTWEQDHVLNPPENIKIEHWFFNTEHNPHLSAEGVQKMKAKYRDPAQVAAKIRGEFVPLTGRVIPSWDRKTSIIPDRELHENAQKVFIIDAHLKTPSAALWAAWEPHPLFGSVFTVYRTVKKSFTVDEWKQYILAQSAGEMIVGWYIDETEGETDVKNIYGEKSIRAAFNKEPNPIPLVQVQKGPGSYRARIFKMRDWFTRNPVNSESRIKIFESCDYSPEYIGGKPQYSLPDELDRFRFKKDQKADEEELRERIAKVNDHFIDDVGYLLTIGDSLEPMKARIVRRKKKVHPVTGIAR